MPILDNVIEGFKAFSLEEIVLSFTKLFVTIDILGAIPIVMAMRQKGQVFNDKQVGIYSCIVLLLFLFLGERLLSFFGVDIYMFGVAGGLILFVMAIEMVFGLQIFQEEEGSTNATFIPLVFPLFAGASAFTTLLLLRSSGMAYINLVIAVVLNMILVYLGLHFVDRIERALGKQGAHVLRKFFGVVLLAISVGFIAESLTKIIAHSRIDIARETSIEGHRSY